MVAEGFHGNRGLVLRARASDFRLSLPSPRRTLSHDPQERSPAMEVIHSRCAGMDIAKRDAKVCIRLAGSGRRRTVETVTTWGATTRQILALREHLVAERVTCVVMEATSDYWKLFYYLLEDLVGVEVMLVNARHVKNLPGRKTDLLTELPRDLEEGCVRRRVRPVGSLLVISDGDVPRELAGLELSRQGCLEATGDLFQPYRLVDGAGAVVVPVAAFFAESPAAR